MTEVNDLVRETFNDRYASIFDPEHEEELLDAQNKVEEMKFRRKVFQLYGDFGQGLTAADITYSGEVDTEGEEESDQEEVEEELSQDIKDAVAEQVKELFQEKLTSFLRPLMWKFKDAQNETVHEHVPCTGCPTEEIKGIRYKSSIYSNMDYCESCEEVGAQESNDVLCKIR